MTASWGPAFDAEIAYRHEQARAHFGRRPRRGWFRRAVPVDRAAAAAAAAAAVAVVTAAAAQPGPPRLAALPPTGSAGASTDAAPGTRKVTRRAA